MKLKNVIFNDKFKTMIQLTEDQFKEHIEAAHRAGQHNQGHCDPSTYEAMVYYEKEVKNNVSLGCVRQRKLHGLYKEIKSQLNAIERARGDSFGIAVKTDIYAKEWQSIRMRFEIIEAANEGRNPNWFHAPYLDAAEAQRRNDSYVA